MSNCQKHRNHHCVHSHNCKDPIHKKKNQRANSASSKLNKSSFDINKKHRPPMGTIMDDQKCQFIYEGMTQGSNLNTQAYMKKISILTAQNDQIKRKLLVFDIENRELKQKNSHLDCQIQYLRSQLDLLVNNHNADISKEIKRNVVEHTELNIKIKELTSSLFDKEKKCEELSSECYSLSRKNKQSQLTIKSYEEKIKIITLKNEELSNSYTELKSKYKQLEKQQKLLGSRYATLASAAQKSTKSAENSSNQLLLLKQKLQKSLKTKESETKRLKELYQIQKKAFQKMNQDLKQQNTKKSQQIKRLKQKVKNAQNHNMEIKEELDHAKSMIMKYEKVNLSMEESREKLKKNFQQNRQDQTLQNKKTISNKGLKQESQSLAIRLKQVQKQRNQLQGRVKELENLLAQTNQGYSNERGVFRQIYKNEPQTVVVNQQLILSVGASDQFRKILEQKNATIKKLMRQKAQLYNKIYQQQAHR